MAGETDLDKLLASVAPSLVPGEFVFCTFENARYGEYQELEPVGAFSEREGLTLVIPRHKADEHGVAYESAFRCVTLAVHSSLDAVGLTAAFSAKLTEHGISANVMAGFFHDHIFVQSDLAEQAVAAIEELAKPDSETGER